MKTCPWCSREFAGPGVRCSKRCRQAAYRLRRRRTTTGEGQGAGRFAYADPPYPGRAKRYYGDQVTFGGEVDHERMVEELLADDLTGFAISTSEDALRMLLPLLPPAPRTHVCVWVKPIAPASLTYGLHNTWEPLVVVGGRQRRPGKRDWLSAQPARGGLLEGEALPGRKPLAFCAFLFEALGMQPGDELVDLFPGSGIVTAAWRELGASSATRGDAGASLGAAAAQAERASFAPRGDASFTPGRGEGVSGCEGSG